MSINMTNVKSITLGGVSVKKIEDTSGRILWQMKSGGTIELTVGEGQDITTSQYANRIVLPSLNTIKNKIASKIGVSSTDVNIKDVKLKNSTLYWRLGPVYGTCYAQLRKTNSSSGTLVSSSGGAQPSTIRDFRGNEYTSVISYMSSSKTTPLYGFYGPSPTDNDVVEFGTSITDNYSTHFCTSSNGKTLPTFTLVVTYE